MGTPLRAAAGKRLRIIYMELLNQLCNKQSLLTNPDEVGLGVSSWKGILLIPQQVPSPRAVRETQQDPVPPNTLVLLAALRAASSNDSTGFSLDLIPRIPGANPEGFN